MKNALPTVKLAAVAPIALIQTGIAYFIQDLLPNTHHLVMTSSFEELLMQWEPKTFDLLVMVLSGTPQEIARDAQQLLQLSDRDTALRIVVCTYCRDVALLAWLNTRPHISLLARQESQEQAKLDMAAALIGTKVCSPSIETRLQDIFPLTTAPCSEVLTQAEQKVLGHLLQGMSVSEISRLLHRSTKTISAHKCNSMRKLGARNDAELFNQLRNLAAGMPNNTLYSPQQGIVW